MRREQGTQNPQFDLYKLWNSSKRFSGGKEKDLISLEYTRKGLKKGGQHLLFCIYIGHLLNFTGAWPRYSGVEKRS